MILGAHESVSGDRWNALERAAIDGCRALQVFTKNGSHWRELTLADSEVQAFRAARDAAVQPPVLAHIISSICALPIHSSRYQSGQGKRLAHGSLQVNRAEVAESEDGSARYRHSRSKAPREPLPRRHCACLGGPSWSIQVVTAVVISSATSSAGTTRARREGQRPVATGRPLRIATNTGSDNAICVAEVTARLDPNGLGRP
jgi:hypothetical protein